MATLNPVGVQLTTIPVVVTPRVSSGTHRRYHVFRWALVMSVIASLPVVGEVSQMLPVLSPVGQTEVPSMLSQHPYFEDFSRDDPMTNSISNLQKLAHILSDAYGNALMHDASNADLEAKDLLLETASIRFSSRMLYEITKGSCQLDEDAATSSSPNHTCVLDDESVGLRGLTDMLSYAAFRLEHLGRAVLPADRTNGQGALVAARMQSMEHLYRMVFALSRIHLDASQSGVYLGAASEQLILARKHMEIERSICACSDDKHTARLQELSEVEDQLKDMRKETRPPRGTSR